MSPCAPLRMLAVLGLCLVATGCGPDFRAAQQWWLNRPYDPATAATTSWTTCDSCPGAARRIRAA